MEHSSRKKILYIQSTLQQTGVTNQLYNIIKYLDHKIFQSTIVTLSPEPKDSRWYDFLKIEASLTSLNMGRFEGVFRAKSSLLNAIDKIRPDVIHTQGIRADTCSALFLGQCQRVATIQNYPCADYPMAYGFIGRLMAAWHYKMLRGINPVVAVSQGVAEDLRIHQISPLYIFNGVDTTHFKPVTLEEKKIIRKKLNLPADAYIFISIGQLSVRKDPETILQAFNIANSHSILIIIGTGELKNKLRNKYNNNSDIIFSGYHKNVLPFLQAADVFISASKAEGLPNSVLEALACGLPCILSDIPPHREIIRHDKNSGAFFSVGKCKQLSRIIQDMCFTDDNKNAALNVARNHLDAKKMSQKYQELYLNMLIG
ncbi:MAG: glycosyltransferase [Desulfovibrionales bacterium]|nr:MAG: glycosyltransferase [Desulfovibrionales bacterium]